MASEAVVKNLFRLELGEGDDGRLSSVGFDVGLTGPVTAFASGVFRGFLTGCDALEVRVPVEFRPNIWVAGTAGVAADETGSCVGRWRRGLRLLSSHCQARR